MTRVARHTVAAPLETHYDTLGCAPASSAERLRAAYYALAVKLHPDKGPGNEEEFKRVALAYGVLKNREFRAAYDTRLRLEHRLDCAACAGAGLYSGFEAGRYRRDQRCKVCNGKGRH